MILETQRMMMRCMTREDKPALCKILQDPEVMKAYEHAFSDEEVEQWLERQLQRYEKDGFGLWALVLKSGGEMIGQCGLTWQMWEERRVLEIGYLLQKAHWGNGYAIEAALACKQYAFDVLGVDEVFSIIRNSNAASQKVAVRNGMVLRGSFVKHYYGVDMPHNVYSVRKMPL